LQFFGWRPEQRSPTGQWRDTEGPQRRARPRVPNT
jgi:hypothetical protein